MTTPDRCGAPTAGGPCQLPPHPRGYHDPAPPVLRVPRNKNGHYQVSITQFRTYGAVDLMGDNPENVRGCPRAYAQRYAAGLEVPEFASRPAELGTALHAALHLMHTEPIGPEDALNRVWTGAVLNFADYAEAREILLGYLDRGGPLTRFETIAAELDLTFKLYDDPDHGPVYFRGIVDNVSIDPAEDDVVARIVDYKSAARPVTRDSLIGDVQMLGYDWLVRNWWRQQYGQDPDAVVCHLDLLRWRDLDIAYTQAERDLWHEWACAVTRSMLRDTAPAPILNDGCTYCPVRFDCPAWQALPEVGESVNIRITGKPARELSGYYSRANLVAKLLDKQVKDIRSALDAEATVAKRLRVGDEIWAPEPASKEVVDILAVVDVLLPEHPNAIREAFTASKASIERAGASLNDPETRDRLRSCVTRVTAGTKITRKKAPVEDGST